MIWEYEVIDHPGRSGLEPVLWTMGENGWELCNSGYEGGEKSVLIFKRLLNWKDVD